MNNAIGIKTASKVYFGVAPKDLKIEQSATLVGMLKNPSYFNPLRRNERTRDRRNVVLSQRVKADFLTENECDSLQKIPCVSPSYISISDKKSLMLPL